MSGFIFHNTIGTLNLTAGKTYYFGYSQTQTITGTINANGNCGNYITIQSTYSGNQTTLSKSSGSITLNYVKLKDVNATGGASFFANNAPDFGNNTGCTLTNNPQEFYWIGGTGNWNDPAHWSGSSGGVGGACLPTQYDNVHFDANSFTTGGQTVSIDATSYCRNMDWTGALNTPSLDGYNELNMGTSQRHSSLQLLRTVLLDRVTTAGPLLSTTGEQKIALFVGPSGVGKTSTIAKLATHYGIVEQRSVALITMDTYRPAAVEHLRLYPEVLGVELSVAASCEEAQEAIDLAREAELILIDTAGFNPYEPIAAQRWRGLLNRGLPMEVHLVLAAATRVPDLVVSTSQCVDVPSLRLLFTKLDETTGYGGIFEATHRTGIPLSYWGTGQRVPDDLVQAHVNRLGDLLLGGQVRTPGGGTNTAWDAQGTSPVVPGNRSYVR